MTQINLHNKLVDNQLTTQELLDKVEVSNTSEKDLQQICETLAHAFDLRDAAEAYFQLYNSKIMINDSVKLADKDNGEIYGLLTLCKADITNGTPILEEDYEFGMELKEFKQAYAHAFVIDERLRGRNIDKKMLAKALKFLMANSYDFVYCGVEKDLRSHSYWKRLGFVELFSIPQATFYLMPLSEKLYGRYL